MSRAHFLYLLLGVTGLAAPKLKAQSCAPCHADISKKFSQTGMGRSFYRLQPNTKIEDFTTQNRYYHLASDTHYEMLQRGDRFYQRRYQIGYDGKEANVDEKQIDFVMGSGTHARTYLHQTPQATLVELPLGWYAEKGGYWAMSPGYDTPVHPGSQRPIGYDCMFCHNAYPKTPNAADRYGDPPIFTGAMPEGIDCQRCHGSGEKHIAATQVPGAKVETIRQAIVNPSRLTMDRQLEVCLQCHLQTDSFRPTLDFKRYGQSYFSYQPGQPLSDFMLYFDVPDKPPAGRFQITSSAYRLRQSACFIKSQGKLQCTTCHNPHDGSYRDACQSCHATIKARNHTAATNCTGCHMLKRRTQDVVKVSMTDHYIQRRPAATESTQSSGPAIPYYPNKLSSDNQLPLAMAQIRSEANLQVTLPYASNHPDPYFELAEARLKARQPKEAVPLYEEALRRDPQYFAALLSLGSVLEDAGTLQRAVAALPSDARPWAALGQLHLQRNNDAEAATALQKAIALDPNFAQPHFGLGIIAGRSGATREAEAEFREAIRIQPFSGDAHANLATLLNLQHDLPQAAWEFDRAVRFEPADLWIRLNYGALLHTMHRTEEAQRQAEAAVQMQSQSAQAHHLLGNVLEQKGTLREALREYQEAVRIEPQISRAQLDLGAVLAQTGDKIRAAQHLKLAATSDDPNVRRIALQLLEGLSK